MPLIGLTVRRPRFYRNLIRCGNERKEREIEDATDPAAIARRRDANSVLQHRVRMIHGVFEGPRQEE